MYTFDIGSNLHKGYMIMSLNNAYAKYTKDNGLTKLDLNRHWFNIRKYMKFIYYIMIIILIVYVKKTIYYLIDIINASDKTEHSFMT